MKSLGKYKILKELGSGAMGKVYQALDTVMNRTVALKVIKWSEEDSPDERAHKRDRLLKDARNAGALLHPNIITIYGFEQEGDSPFIVMEFVNGPTLTTALTGGARLDPQQVVRYVRQACEALDYAHRRHLVHRDIKPDNLMIGEEDALKIADFGISKVISETATGATVTRTGVVVGTPHYMSPEQIQGLPLDGRSDQFSMAIVAYQMATGHKPFEGQDITTVLYKIAFEDPAPPELLNPELGPAVGKVLRKALAKRPAQRYATCVEFAAALESALASDQASQVFETSPLTFSPRTVRTAARFGWMFVRRRALALGWSVRRSRRRKLAAYGALALLLLLGLGLLVLPWRRSGEPKPAAVVPEQAARPVPLFPPAPAPAHAAAQPAATEPSAVEPPREPASPPPKRQVRRVPAPPKPAEEAVEPPAAEEEAAPEVKPSVTRPTRKRP